jgi:hypothetical protein
LIVVVVLQGKGNLFIHAKTKDHEKAFTLNLHPVQLSENFFAKHLPGF